MRFPLQPRITFAKHTYGDFVSVCRYTLQSSAPYTGSMQSRIDGGYFIEAQKEAKASALSVKGKRARYHAAAPANRST